MRQALRWAAYALGGLAALVLVLALGVFVGSEAIYAKTYPQPKPEPLKVSAARLPMAEGERLAAVFGCSDCHGKDLRGRLFHDEPQLARLYAPNLTRLAQRYSDADLRAAITHGVSKTGRGLWVMPSATFSRMTPDEVDAIVAYVRAQPPGGAEQPKVQMGPLGRIGMVLGKFHPEPERLRGAREPLFAGAGLERGRHIAATACAECHGLALEGGDAPLNTPDLDIAAAYEPADFKRLMRTGVAAGGRHVGMMSEVARYRFARLTDAEVEQLHSYLRARAAARPAAGAAPAG